MRQARKKERKKSRDKSTKLGQEMIQMTGILKKKKVTA